MCEPISTKSDGGPIRIPAVEHAAVAVVAPATIPMASIVRADVDRDEEAGASSSQLQAIATIVPVTRLDDRRDPDHSVLSSPTQVVNITRLHEPSVATSQYYRGSTDRGRASTLAGNRLILAQNLPSPV